MSLLQLRLALINLENDKEMLDRLNLEHVKNKHTDYEWERYVVGRYNNMLSLALNPSRVPKTPESCLTIEIDDDNHNPYFYVTVLFAPEACHTILLTRRRTEWSDTNISTIQELEDCIDKTEDNKLYNLDEILGILDTHTIKSAIE